MLDLDPYALEEYVLVHPVSSEQTDSIDFVLPLVLAVARLGPFVLTKPSKRFKACNYSALCKDREPQLLTI